MKGQWKEKSKKRETKGVSLQLIESSERRNKDKITQNVCILYTHFEQCIWNQKNKISKIMVEKIKDKNFCYEFYIIQNMKHMCAF